MADLTNVIMRGVPVVGTDGSGAAVFNVGSDGVPVLAGTSATVDEDVGGDLVVDGTLSVTGTASFTAAATLHADSALSDGVDLAIGTTTGTKIGTGATQKIGLWNATPVVQPATTGQTAGFTAGAGAAVLVDSVFTGGTGTKAYTVGDIVKALKAAGIMASS